MPIHFDSDRWEKVRNTYDLWWKHELDRPIMQIIITDGYEPQRRKPEIPLLAQANCTDFQYKPEEIIDRIDYELSQYEFLGDAFPMVNFDSFGPGILAAFCGAKLDNSTGRVWFFPEKIKEIKEIHVEYQPDSTWAKRIKEIYRAGLEKWDGQVLMGMPDLGGVLDVAAVFRGSENLLYDLYDEPEEVKRLCREIENAWIDAYQDLNRVLAAKNPGYSDWLGIYSSVESYVVQSDFSYMISEPMFREFAVPSIKRSGMELQNMVYHLDGIGEIKHLDCLLTLDSLNAVQWVPGDGQLPSSHWIDLYKKIEKAGKGIKIEGDIGEFEKIYSSVSKGLCFSQKMVRKDRMTALRILEKYGVK